MSTTVRLGVTSALLFFGLAPAPPTQPRNTRLDDLVAVLGGHDEPARALARQLLPRVGVEAVPKLTPLLSSAEQAVSAAAFQVLADIANEAAAPGRDADRATITRRVLELLDPGQPEAVRLRALRLLPIAVPDDYELGPVSHLLDDPALREKARVALEESSTQRARAVLREALGKSTDPAFTVALLDSLGRLRDDSSLEAIRRLARGSNPMVRIAAVRALAWAGDPQDLPTALEFIAEPGTATRSDALDALLRLTDALSRKAEYRSTARGVYARLLQQAVGPAKSAALAGLGRVGDAADVDVVLAAARSTHQPTARVAFDSLRKMPGRDVTRVLVAAYPAQPARIRDALLPILAARQDATALPFLVEAAGASSTETRRAALSALGDSGLPGACKPLIEALKSGDEHDRGVARSGLLALAGRLAVTESRQDAGRAYAALLTSQTDPLMRSRALVGLAACPVVEAFEPLTRITREGPRDPAFLALVRVARSLADAGRPRDALALRRVVRDLKPDPEDLAVLAKEDRELSRGLRGTVRHWWVIGPFELGPRNEGWETAYVGEPRVDLVARFMAGKRRVGWTPVIAQDDLGKIDLREKVGNRDRCIGYAYAEVNLESSAEAVLLLGVDDSEIIWVNGKKVYESFRPRGLTVDEDRVPVSLQAGTNKILLKLYQETLGWEFCLRIVDRDGRPVAFTEKTE